MSKTDLEKLAFFNNILSLCSKDPSCNDSQLTYHNTSLVYDLDFPGDGSPWLRIVTSVVYFVVAITGIVGNLLVMFLLYSTRTITTGTINFFVFNLALAHLLFSMALPFWAVDNALDYSWPFGLAMCKAVSLLTGLNVYASCFFLTAMSLTRYCSVATALNPTAPLCNSLRCSQVATVFIWAGALIAASPRAIFADVKRVGDDMACLLRFPDGTAWLGINQLLRVVLGILLPYAIIILSHLLLLRFLCRHKLRGINPRRKARVSKSVAVVVLSFCACWFPYNILTLWSVLIHLNINDISPSFYLVQTYFFPLANCLAFTSSCLNPVIYCLVRREYRLALHNLILKVSVAVMSRVCLYKVNSNEGQAGQLAIPFNNMDSQTVQSVNSDTRLVTPPTVPSSVSIL
ncbi:relaxin-3 receptor 1-like [Lampris incognitus]|uniref:relaxin-3 receptor 1-like n=1 Tax=Lampris incognitus TaxID=2546036 RepID=UPI0024B62AEB|nr:relaxin-3 receptor 1-like [Lampris incognitus]